MTAAAVMAMAEVEVDTVYRHRRPSVSAREPAPEAITVHLHRASVLSDCSHASCHHKSVNEANVAVDDHTGERSQDARTELPALPILDETDGARTQKHVERPAIVLRAQQRGSATKRRIVSRDVS